MPQITLIGCLRFWVLVSVGGCWCLFLGTGVGLRVWLWVSVIVVVCGCGSWGLCLWMLVSVVVDVGLLKSVCGRWGQVGCVCISACERPHEILCSRVLVCGRLLFCNWYCCNACASLS